MNQVVSATDLGGGRTQLSLIYPTQQAYPAEWTLAQLTMSDTIRQSRATYNGVFDSNTGAWEAIAQICRVGRAVPTKIGNRIGVRIERDAEPVQHINDSNMIAGSFSIDYIGSAERPDNMQLQFLDDDQDFDQNVAPATITNPNLDRAIVPVTESAYGITNIHQARREAQYRLRARNLVRRKCEFDMSLDGIAAEPGDVISIGSMMPGWSLLSSRANGTLDFFQIDHDITLESNVDYEIVVSTPEHPHGVRAKLSSTGEKLAGSTINSLGDSIALKDAPCVIGYENQVGHPLAGDQHDA